MAGLEARGLAALRGPSRRVDDGFWAIARPRIAPTIPADATRQAGGHDGVRGRNSAAHPPHESLI